MAPEDDQIKRRLETCLTLYRQQMEHYHKTQDVEWKGTFGAWTLVTTAVALTFQKDARLLPGFWAWLVLLLPLFHSTWLYKIHKSEEYDKDLWVKYRNAACNLVGLSETPFTGDVPVAVEI